MAELEGQAVGVPVASALKVGGAEAVEIAETEAVAVREMAEKEAVPVEDHVAAVKVCLALRVPVAVAVEVSSEENDSSGIMVELEVEEDESMGLDESMELEVEEAEPVEVAEAELEPVEVKEVAAVCVDPAKPRARMGARGGACGRVTLKNENRRRRWRAEGPKIRIFEAARVQLGIYPTFRAYANAPVPPIRDSCTGSPTLKFISSSSSS